MGQGPGHVRELRNGFVYIVLPPSALSFCSYPHSGSPQLLSHWKLQRDRDYLSLPPSLVLSLTDRTVPQCGSGRAALHFVIWGSWAFRNTENARTVL